MLTPSKEAIKALTCHIYRVSEENLVKSKRRMFNEPRSLAIYLTRQLRGKNLAEICREYGLKTYSSESSAVVKERCEMNKHRRFKKGVDKVAWMLV